VSTPGGPVVRFEQITKRFPGVLALDGVTLDIAAGSCHGLVGENGAGKSTLGKVLAGIYPVDDGRLFVGGRQVSFAGPRDALQAGIGIVHQELLFCENLSVAENLCLESLPARGPFVSYRRMHARARGLLAAIGAEMDVTRRLGDLAISQQQLVQIAGAVGRGARVIVCDEPTSSLSQKEAERLFSLLRMLQGQGATCIYISHRLPELFALCDTISVLRDGRLVTTRPAGEFDEASLVEAMIGRTLGEYFPSHLECEPGEELLRVEGLSSPGRFSAVSLSVRAGEVVGLAGLVGAGRTQVAEAIFGLDPAATGQIWVGGRRLHLGRPRQAVSSGLGLVPEDRKRHGLVLGMDVRSNVTLPMLHRLARLGWVRRGAERALVGRFMERIRIRAPSPEVPVGALSGGNQQKAVLARWLAAHCRVLILDEPTRGVDVGAKAEIHALINQLAREGSGVLLISSELPEIVNLASRVVVLRGGRVVAEVPHGEATQEHLLRLMAGIGQQ